jgi:hypothetical protein
MQQAFATCRPLIGPGGLFAGKLTLCATTNRSKCARKFFLGALQRLLVQDVSDNNVLCQCVRIRIQSNLNHENQPVRKPKARKIEDAHA